MQFLRTVLENGLPVVAEHNPDALSMAVGYFVRTGARDEETRIAGVSHFLEHMLFKGTERRSAEDVNREFDEIGAQYNAFTSEENTVYYGAVLPEFQARAIDLLTDMMRPSIRESDFTMEKNVILEEIALYRDRPHFTVMDEARATYFEGHALGHSVLGTPDTIGPLTHEQMRDYWRQRYATGNMSLVLSGNFDWDAALEQVRGLTRDWEPARAHREVVEPAPKPQVRVIPNEKFNRAHLTFVTPGVAAQSPDRFTADVVATCIGSSEGSRLFWELVDPGRAEAARTYHDEMDGAGAFFTYVSCDPERAQEIVDRVRDVLARTRASGLTEEEIDRAKRKIASALVMESETPFGRLLHVGFDWQYRGELVPADRTIDAVLAVDAAGVGRFLEATPIDEPTIVALGPLSSLR